MSDTTSSGRKPDVFEVSAQLESMRKDAKSFDDLISILQYIKDHCSNDYDVVTKATSQTALATLDFFAREFDLSEFQSQYITLDILFAWSYKGNKCGIIIKDIDDMLYPQYQYRFEKTISQETFDDLQKEAARLLMEMPYAEKEVRDHWLSIALGKPPFGYEVKQARCDS